MAREVENSIKLAILSCPQCFGLTAAEVNPLLMRLQQVMEFGDPESLSEDWQRCCSEVNTTLHQKVAEILSVAPKAKSQGSQSEPQPETRNRQRHTKSGATDARSPAKPAGPARAPSEPQRELSVKQLRYLGYLIRQTGEEPDYTINSKLSQKEATLRIKDLEAKVNAR